jgi:hypothetical protein
MKLDPTILAPCSPGALWRCAKVVSLASLLALSPAACTSDDDAQSPWTVSPDGSVAPTSVNYFVDRVSVSVSGDKLDLLFMIDNSISMADKQELFGLAVPALVGRFVDPVCIDTQTEEPIEPVVTESQGCPAGT